MPRTARAIAAGYCYHVINRGNNRAQRFHGAADYDLFARLMAEACDRFPLGVIAACLMPNHVHLVVRPTDDSSLPRWVHWLFLTYSRRYHFKYGSTGRVWENRYKAFPIQGDAHLLTVLRYVERNALRADLTERAEDWAWGSLHWRMNARTPLMLTDPPIELPSNWRKVVNTPLTEEELAAVRNSVNRQCPFGDLDWVKQTAGALGLEHSIAPRGRPRLDAEKKCARK